MVVLYCVAMMIFAKDFYSCYKPIIYYPSMMQQETSADSGPHLYKDFLLGVDGTRPDKKFIVRALTGPEQVDFSADIEWRQRAELTNGDFVCVHHVPGERKKVTLHELGGGDETVFEMHRRDNGDMWPEVDFERWIEFESKDGEVRRLEGLDFRVPPSLGEDEVSVEQGSVNILRYCIDRHWPDGLNNSLEELVLADFGFDLRFGFEVQVPTREGDTLLICSPEGKGREVSLLVEDGEAYREYLLKRCCPNDPYIDELGFVCRETGEMYQAKYVVPVLKEKVVPIPLDGYQYAGHA